MMPVSSSASVMLSEIHRSMYWLSVKHLPDSLREVMAMFYLVLRAMDTIEDDPNTTTESKIPRLLSFNETIHDEGLSMDCSDPKYKPLMQNFGSVVARSYGGITDAETRDVIRMACMHMGRDMATSLGHKVQTWGELHTYCQSVAGMLGAPVTLIFSKYLDPSHADRHISSQTLSAVFRFIQQVDIILDFREDTMDGKCYWPHELILTDDPTSLLDPANRVFAVSCMNVMIRESLRTVKDHGLLGFDSFSPKVWVAGAATMMFKYIELMYNNPKVFDVNKVRIGFPTSIWEAADEQDVQNLRRSSLNAIGVEAAHCGDDETVQMVRDILS